MESKLYNTYLLLNGDVINLPVLPYIILFQAAAPISHQGWGGGGGGTQRKSTQPTIVL